MFLQNLFNLTKTGGLMWLVFFLSLTSFSQELLLNQPIEKEIKLNETQVFEIKAQANEFARVVLWQKNANVKLKLFSSKDDLLIESDNSNTTEEPERISFIANQTGEFRLEINATRIWRTPGSYQIELQTLRPAVEKDKSLIEAEKLYNQAVFVAWFSDQPNGKELAIKTFNDSLPHFQTAQDRFGEGFVHYYLGILYSRGYDIPKSIESFTKAVRIFRETESLPALAMALSDEAAIYYAVGRLKEATEMSQEAYQIYRQLDDRPGMIKVGGNLAVIDYEAGNLNQALKKFEEILPVFQAKNDPFQESWALHHIGSIYNDLGETGKGIEYLEKALKIRQELGETEKQAGTLVNLAFAQKKIGEYPKAIENLQKALEIFQQRGNVHNQIFCFNNLGTVYDDLGDYLQAVQNYEKSLQLSRQHKLREYEAGNLNNLTVVSLKLGDFEKALEFQTKSIEIFRELKNKPNEAKAMVNLSAIWQRKNNYPKALEFLQAALPIFQETGERDWEAQVYFHLGEIELLSGNFRQSFENCAKSLEIKTQIGHRQGEMVALLCTAKAEMNLGWLSKSQIRIEKALNLVEDLRMRLGRQDWQANFLASRQDFYEFYIELLMRRHKIEPKKGFDALALQMSEQARARNLLESIGNTELSEGVSPALLTEEKELRKKINQQEALRQQLISAKAVQEKLAEIEKEIEASLRGLRDVWAKIRLANPKLADFTQPTTLSLAEIQNRVLDENSVLLEFALGTERSFLFVVTQNSLKTVELPKRAEIETLTRNFYESLKAQTKRIPNEIETSRKIRLQKADDERKKTALTLSKILLSPAAKEIENKRLLIVASEVLQYIPFAALLSPKTENQFLIETNEVVNLPSASTLATLRKNTRQPASKEIAIFADPIFSGNDARMPSASPFRSNFQRLDFSRQEAEKIASFAPAEKRLLALDFQANLQNLRSQDLRQFRLLHFATHGTLDSRFPELSGIVLSLVDEKGASQEGFLHLSEIYNLKLNAKMVVLSACETGLGNYIKGEGLVGFTHAFMYAGTESVVASLWQVDDYATSELMQRFYQAMLKDGLPPVKALQKAQISMIKEKGLNHPFYWSAFTLQGEWK